MALLSPLSLYTPSMLKFLCDENDFQNNANVIYFKRGDAEYENLRQGFNKRINKYPKVIAQCFNELGVSEAIKYAKKYQLPIAVKSGGHCMEGFSCNNDGMVINIANLNKIVWVNSNTVTVGPGCKLAELYNEILPKNKILPGGSCAGVAIGGLTLGGGYGLLSRRFGLTCDNLTSLQMVDGKGNICNADGASELMWACKGGNNGNFGVVTSLTFKLHDAPKTMQSFKFRCFNTTPERAAIVLEEWFKISSDLPDYCFSSFLLNKKTLYILITNTGKHTEVLQQIINKLSSLCDKSTQSVKLPLANALKNYYGRQYPLYFKNASAGLFKNYDDIKKYITDVFSIVTQTSGMIFQLNTLGGKITSSELEASSSFPHRNYNVFSELQTYWESPNQQQKLLDRFQEVQLLFAKHGINNHYRNYPDINFINWKESYYSKNYQQLKQIKSKYDPDNLFRYEQSI